MEDGHTPKMKAYRAIFREHFDWHGTMNDFIDLIMYAYFTGIPAKDLDSFVVGMQQYIDEKTESVCKDIYPVWHARNKAHLKVDREMGLVLGLDAYRGVLTGYLSRLQEMKARLEASG